MTWTLPNILTVIRLLAAPGIAFAYLFLAAPWADWVALTLFIGAALTDYVDGYLARAWNQESRFGAMLDPIADKAMVVIALMVLSGLSGLSVWVVIPAALILFREVFVSGLREFLGAQAGLLQVTRLAKWKTTVQMVAIAVLMAQGLFSHYFGMWAYGMDAELVDQILAGEVEDTLGLRLVAWMTDLTGFGGIILLWLAGLLTMITGWDYFAKALPFLTEEPAE